MKVILPGQDIVGICTCIYKVRMLYILLLGCLLAEG